MKNRTANVHLVRVHSHGIECWSLVKNNGESESRSKEQLAMPIMQLIGKKNVLIDITQRFIDG